MESPRSRRSFSVAVLTAGHASFAAVLGLAACGLALSGAIGPGFHGSIRDPAIPLTLTLTVASLLAAGSGISAFILLSIERVEVTTTTRARRPSL